MSSSFKRCVLVLVVLESATAPAVAAGQDTQYEVRKELNVMVPIREGVELSLDIYRPEAPGRYPVILNRTPYE